MSELIDVVTLEGQAIIVDVIAAPVPILAVDAITPPPPIIHIEIIPAISGGGGAPTGPAGGALSGTYPDPGLAVAYLPLSGGSMTGALQTTDITATYLSLRGTYVGIDLRKNDNGAGLKNWLLQTQSSGAMHLDSYDDGFSGVLKTWSFNRDGTTTFPGNVTAPNIVPITVGTTAPSSPGVGDVWIDTN